MVLDASAALELLLRTAVAPRIETRVRRQGMALHCPHLFDLEVVQVIRRQVQGRRMSRHRAREALEDLVDLPLTRWPHGPFLDRIWELGLTAYDGAYVALAEALGAPLLTSDARLARTSGHRAQIELVSPR